MLLIPVGCLVVLAGALIAALTLDVGVKFSDAWQLRVKLAALSGLTGGGAGFALGMAAALLAAMFLGRSSDSVPGLGATILVAASWLVVVTALSVVVDVWNLDTDDGPGGVGGFFGGAGGIGFVIGQLLTDLGVLVVAGAAVALGGRSMRD